MKVKRIEREQVEVMLSELLEHKLEVVLVPAPSPRHADHYIRCVVNQPPRWFSEVAGRYLRSSPRFPRARPNFIKRAATLRALEAISKGEIKTTYARRWYNEIQRILANEIPF